MEQEKIITDQMIDDKMKELNTELKRLQELKQKQAPIGGGSFMNPETRGFGELFDESKKPEVERHPAPGGFVPGDVSGLNDFFTEDEKSKSR